METTKKILSVLLALLFVITVMPVAKMELLFNANAKSLSQYEVGDIIEFGTYPQSEVKDGVLLSELNSLPLNWVSYGYYVGTGEYADGNMQPSDFMKYADVTHGGEKYRAVMFTQYRPDKTYMTSSEDDTEQTDNGYYVNTVYWFKYEPLQWRVLDPEEGFIMCENLIDAQAYNNTDYKGFQDKSSSVYANDYAGSSIREWLNDDFYNTAFNEAEKAEIQITEMKNVCISHMDSDYSKYDSENTSDKIFLLSYDEVKNSKYGFSMDESEKDMKRRAQGTDYAKAQGLHTELSYEGYIGNSPWWLRSPYSGAKGACEVTLTGYSREGSHDVILTNKGVRPALKFNPKPLAENIDSEEAEDNNKNTDLKNPSDSPVIGVVIAGVVAGVVIIAGVAFIILKKKK